MTDLPQKLSRGAALPAAWLNRLLDWCRSRDLRAGPGIKLTRTPSGTTISLGPRGGVLSPALGDVVVGVVTQNNGGGVVKVRIKRAAGAGYATFESCVTPEVSQLSDIPPGTAVLAHAVETQLSRIDEG